MSLHEALTRRIDELERIAKAADAEFPGPWRHNQHTKWICDGENRVIDSAAARLGTFMTTQDPAAVLRGLTEDRDILARHQRDHIYNDQQWHCCVCVDSDMDNERWPCPDVLSLARRHGLDPQES